MASAGSKVEAERLLDTLFLLSHNHHRFDNNDDDEDDNNDAQLKASSQYLTLQYDDLKRLVQQTFQATPQGTITALHISRHLHVTELLLFLLNGIDTTNTYINAVDAFGNTPLHLAAVDGNVAHVQLFLAHGADPTICNHSDGHTPLCKAVRDCDHVDSRDAVVQTFLQHARGCHSTTMTTATMQDVVFPQAVQQAIASNRVSTAILLLQGAPMLFSITASLLHFCYEEAPPVCWEAILPWLLLRGDHSTNMMLQMRDPVTGQTMMDKAMERDDVPSAVSLVQYGAGFVVSTTSAADEMEDEDDEPGDEAMMP